MLTNNQRKYIQSLHQKKFRQQSGAFLVEGAKSVQEVLASDFTVDMLLATEGFCKENARLIDNKRTQTEIVPVSELERVTTLESNNAAVAVVKTKDNRPLVAGPGEFVLVLDDVRDPGNLGTILRIADWYGIRKLICSDTTAEVYNPKVISASKGSFTRVNWWYGNLPAFFAGVSKEGGPEMPVYGAFLDGNDVHTMSFGKGGYLVMGNESNGIGPAVSPFITEKITIPRFGEAESLNVGIATAVIVDNWKRSTK
ncbi:TrmH family RNA methyltransferase [Arsenicibacter rosenii]|uniref:RNA methyltransferase n=1 Tax=Arsenicibacter rosenii TaxID=1750698 RepID=A0A1S2VQQ1_9BACT|nr:RNA methyltransferase [Arsenicibacter rosenii]OIN61092.1 RNA methyltransferase [Arsenicibacter rosenii]